MTVTRWIWLPEFKPDLLHGVMTLKGQGYHLLSDGHTTLPTSVTAIPYYAWDNRGANEMNVWIPYTREASIPRRTETLASQAQASVSIPYGGYGLNPAIRRINRCSFTIGGNALAQKNGLNTNGTNR